MHAGTWPFVKFLVFIDESRSKSSYVALGVLILNICMLLDVLNSGRVLFKTYENSSRDQRSGQSQQNLITSLVHSNTYSIDSMLHQCQ